VRLAYDASSRLGKPLVILLKPAETGRQNLVIASALERIRDEKLSQGCSRHKRLNACSLLATNAAAR
jgi:hypothetical protein